MLQSSVENGLSEDKTGISSKPVYTELTGNTKSQYAEMMSSGKRILLGDEIAGLIKGKPRAKYMRARDKL